MEAAALDALQSRLLTPELAEVFVTEFTREVERLARTRDEREEEIRRRLDQLELEIENLSRNLLAGVVSSTLAAMLTSREGERDRLQAQIGRDVSEDVRILPHPALVRRFEEKVAGTRNALNDPSVRGEAAQTIRSLIGSITIEVVDGEVVADVEASARALIDFAANDSAPRRSLSEGRSVAVVGGTGYDLDRTVRSVEVVAGAGFDRCRTRVALTQRRVARR